MTVRPRREQALRRLAFQITLQLPSNKEEARATLKHACELVECYMFEDCDPKPKPRKLTVVS